MFVCCRDSKCILGLFYLLLCKQLVSNANTLGLSLSLQMFGCGALAQQVLSNGTHGIFLTVNLAFGFAATLGILVCGQISGRL